MSVFDITPAHPHDRESIVRLWTRCGLVRPYNPPEHDIDFARGRDGSDILVLRLADGVIGSVMVGHDGHRGWIYYLAVDPDHQRNGHGERLVRAAEQWLRERQVRKCQLMVRDTNIGVVGFYDRLGYERSPVTVMQRWLDGTEVS